MGSSINRLIPADDLHLVDGRYSVMTEEELERFTELCSNMTNEQALKAIRDFEISRISALLYKQFLLGNIELNFEKTGEITFSEKRM